jgi:hypothetical protein
MKKIILLFIVVSLILLNIAIVSACSCVQPAPPKESLEQSTAVFAGKVVDINVSGGAAISSADPVTVTFEVSKIWKGLDNESLVLTTARDGASCGYSFKQGEEYLVYTYGEGDKLSTGICSRTRLLASAKDDLQELGDGSLPANSDMPQPSNFIPIISIAGIIILFLIIVLLVLKYKK